MWAVSAMESQDMVEDSKNKESYADRGFTVLQKHAMGFLSRLSK